MARPPSIIPPSTVINGFRLLAEPFNAAHPEVPRDLINSGGHRVALVQCVRHPEHRPRYVLLPLWKAERISHVQCCGRVYDPAADDRRGIVAPDKHRAVRMYGLVLSRNRAVSGLAYNPYNPNTPAEALSKMRMTAHRDFWECFREPNDGQAEQILTYGCDMQFLVKKPNTEDLELLPGNSTIYISGELFADLRAIAGMMQGIFPTQFPVTEIPATHKEAERRHRIHAEIKDTMRSAILDALLSVGIAPTSDGAAAANWTAAPVSAPAPLPQHNPTAGKPLPFDLAQLPIPFVQVPGSHASPLNGAPLVNPHLDALTHRQRVALCTLALLSGVTLPGSLDAIKAFGELTPFASGADTYFKHIRGSGPSLKYRLPRFLLAPPEWVDAEPGRPLPEIDPKFFDMAIDTTYDKVTNASIRVPLEPWPEGWDDPTLPPSPLDLI